MASTETTANETMQAGSRHNWTDRERKFMKMAIETARKAIVDEEVAVGCVFVDTRTDRVIAATHNETTKTRNASRHCELVAVDQILGRDASLRPEDIFPHCELYVTVEPCIMCAAALRIIKIGRVVYGCANPRFGGTGSVLFLHDTKRSEGLGYECIGGLDEQQAIALLKSFYAKGNPNAPAAKRARSLESRGGGGGGDDNDDATLDPPSSSVPPSGNVSHNDKAKVAHGKEKRGKDNEEEKNCSNTGKRKGFDERSCDD
mmetsp:Transcript_10541/g.16881  ORF Transcript_10541/g.16881 Transcript_10541/m.16881 type:complete len:260 (+) Transcript_10541:144-923(+)